MKPILPLWSLAFLSIACPNLDGAEGEGEGEADDGPCAETAEVVYCDGDSNCAFDPAEIDCSVACAHMQTICGLACADEYPVCDDFEMGNCQTGCDYAKNQACPNVTFGCEAAHDTCDGLSDCIADNK